MLSINIKILHFEETRKKLPFRNFKLKFSLDCHMFAPYCFRVLQDNFIYLKDFEKIKNQSAKQTSQLFLKIRMTQ